MNNYYCDNCEDETYSCCFTPINEYDKIVHKISEKGLTNSAIPQEIKEGIEKMEKNNINHPEHYNRENATECIDEMILVFGEEAVKNFCLCNVWKYRYRAAGKNGEEDLKKSDWYMKKYIELNNPSIAKTIAYIN